MAQVEQQAPPRAEDLRRELFGLVRTEREIRREIGARVLNGEQVVDLRALRLANREEQEDVSASVILLDAATP